MMKKAKKKDKKERKKLGKKLKKEKYNSSRFEPMNRVSLNLAILPQNELFYGQTLTCQIPF